ncbi:MAG: methylated-DNA--[protein]-cysteine S-methyltransferase, partial [Leptothrix sp. (in: b-proteobacteria)]
MTHPPGLALTSPAQAAPHPTRIATAAPLDVAPLHWCRHASPLGTLVLAASADGLRGVWFEGQAHFDGPAPGWRHDAAGAVPLLAAAVTQLDDWLGGRRRGFELPLDPVGTPFQRRVWQAIAAIGWGERRSYGEVAAAVGQPQAARAIGAATGRNPLSIVVP